jgi:hypothetical protein
MCTCTLGMPMETPDQRLRLIYPAQTEGPTGLDPRGRGTHEVAGVLTVWIGIQRRGTHEVAGVLTVWIVPQGTLNDDHPQRPYVRVEGVVVTHDALWRHVCHCSDPRSTP